MRSILLSVWLYTLSCLTGCDRNSGETGSTDQTEDTASDLDAGMPTDSDTATEEQGSDTSSQPGPYPYPCHMSGDYGCWDAIFNADIQVIAQLRDNDCDGTDDWCIEWEYDDSGNLVTETHDIDCDGVPDICETHTYDDRGNELSETRDEACDGVFERCIERQYDNNDAITLETYDEGCDGLGLGDTCYHYANDAEGRVVEDYTDHDCDQTPMWCDRYTYDADGNKIEVLSDSNCVFSDYIKDVYSYDENGNVLTKESIDITNGEERIIFILCTYYTYNDDGNPLTIADDNDCDGSIEHCDSYVYDEIGNLTTHYMNTGSSCSLDDFDYDRRFSYRCWQWEQDHWAYSED